MSLPESLFGSWELVSVYYESTTGDVLYLFGEDPKGLLIYDPKGYVSIVLTRRGRSKIAYAPGDPYSGSPQEIKEAFDNSSAYCGTFSVDAEKGTVTHHVEASLRPNWKGTHQVRNFELEGDVLVLFTPGVKMFDKEWVAYVTWARAASTHPV